MELTGWPSFEQAQALALKAKSQGFTLSMFQLQNGSWSWVWFHVETCTPFEGDCDNIHQAVALICALQDLPLVVTISVDGQLETDS